MENQEGPKKPIPEELEQQKNLEQNNKESTEPIEENKDALSDITKKIVEKEKSIDDAQTKINNITRELGGHPSNETPPSIRIERDSIQILKQEKHQIEERMKQLIGRATKMNFKGVDQPVITDSKDVHEYKELKKRLDAMEDTASSGVDEKIEETKRFESNLKTALEDISTTSKTMLDALYERQQNGLVRLQSNESFQMMASSIRNLKNLESRIDVDSVSNLIKNIETLNRSFDEIKIQRSASVKENPQNLEKLAFGAKKFSSTVEESGRKLAIEMIDKEMQEKSKELRNSLQRLSEQSQKLWIFASRLRENI